MAISTEVEAATYLPIGLVAFYSLAASLLEEREKWNDEVGQIMG
jgi:hypothetical protein